MTPADRIIEKFGSVSDLSKALGHRHVTTVRSWRDRGGLIPARQVPKIIAAARAQNISLAPADFIPAHEPAPSTEASATPRPASAEAA